MKLRRIFLTLILGLVAANIGGQQASAATTTVNASVEGSWLVTVNISAPGFPPSFTALETYDRGGGVVTSNNLPPVPRPGQGVWSYKGGRYSARILFFTFDSNGNQTGSIRVSHRFEISGDEYSGEGTAEFFDANGNPTVSLAFTSSGTRIPDLS